MILMRDGSSEFLTACYEVAGPESQARATTERICVDQTIEGDARLLTPSLQSMILGRLENLRPTTGGTYEVTVQYPGELLSGDCSDVLNLLFGTSSLRGDVRLCSFTLTKGLLAWWRGPRFGMEGLRRAVGVFHRPVVCAVLKPLGRSPQELATLAVQCVEGGVDMIKDDQSLVDQQRCPFEERVTRCAEAIRLASQRRGRPCLYFSHISGAWDVMCQRATLAKAAGVTGLLVAPGLTGFDVIRALASDDNVALPIACHPAMLGTLVDRGRGGFSEVVAYGLLPRLAGADLSIYPAFGSDYPIGQRDCVAVTEQCLQPWGHLRSMMPALGGRIGPERVAELQSVVGREIVFITGSHIQQHPSGVTAAIQAIVRALEEP